MKILFDHQIFASQTYGGVSRYFTEVIRRLPRSMWEVSTSLSNNHYARFHQIVQCPTFMPRINFSHKGRLMAELGKPYSLMRIRRGSYDIFHPTNFDTYGIASLGRRPMVITYHDTNFVSTHNPNRRMARLQQLSLARANRVIAVSENTRRDIINHFDINPDKISVIYHGVSTLPNDVFAKIKAPAFPYILYVGLRHSFKNFHNFIRAFALIAQQYPEVEIICTREPFNADEQKLFHQLGIAKRMHIITADEATLACLYSNALLFIFPSCYEGFGMPILEAMAYGTPCALSNASCFPEIAANAALYFPPDDIHAIASTISELLSNNSLRKTMRQRGFKRAALFTWEKCVEQHINLYKSML